MATEKYGYFEIKVFGSIKPFTMSSGTQYLFIVDGKEVANLAAHNWGPVSTAKVRLPCGVHTVKIKMYSHDNNPKTANPIDESYPQAFIIEEGKTTCGQITNMSCITLKRPILEIRQVENE